jgi:hypothetical protein
MDAVNHGDSALVNEVYLTDRCECFRESRFCYLIGIGPQLIGQTMHATYSTSPSTFFPNRGVATRLYIQQRLQNTSRAVVSKRVLRIVH